MSLQLDKVILRDAPSCYVLDTGSVQSQSGFTLQKNVGEWPVTFGDAIKRIKEDVYGGYLVRFTDESKRDLTGEYFDADTDFMTGVYPIKGLRTLYEHGFDEDIGSIPVGEIVDARIDKDGLFVEQKFDFLAKFKAYLGELAAPEKWKEKQIEVARQYHSMLRDLLDNGQLGWSSGAHPPGVRVAPSGHIDRWPIWEATNTPRPAMPFETGIRRIKSVDAKQLKDLLTPLAKPYRE